MVFFVASLASHSGRRSWPLSVPANSDATIHLVGYNLASETLQVKAGAEGEVKVPLDTDWTALAWRLALIRRDTLRQRLAEFGVPVVRWHGAGSLDQVLLGLTRAAAMPRRRA